MSDWRIDIVLAFVMTISAALLAYLFSVTVTKKGVLHSAKLEAYRRISGLSGEAKTLLYERLEIDEIDASSTDLKVIMANHVRLCRTLWFIGQAEYVSTLNEEKKLNEAVKQGRASEFLGELKRKTIRLVTDRIVQNVRELMLSTSVLALVRPSERVKSSSHVLVDRFILGAMIPYKNMGDKFQGIALEIKTAAGGPAEVPATIPSLKEWKIQTDASYTQLTNAMDEDLRKTISWFHL